MNRRRHVRQRIAPSVWHSDPALPDGPVSTCGNLPCDTREAVDDDRADQDAGRNCCARHRSGARHRTCAIALRLAEEGGRTPRSSDEALKVLEETAALIDARGGAYHVAAVVTSTTRPRSQMPSAQATSQARTDRSPVTNAGPNVVFGPTWAIDPAAWWSDIETNLYGPFPTFRALLVLPSMIERRQGRIAGNIASGAGNVPFPRQHCVCLFEGGDRPADGLSRTGRSPDSGSPSLRSRRGPCVKASRLASLSFPAAQVYIGDTLDTLDVRRGDWCRLMRWPFLRREQPTR